MTLKGEKTAWLVTLSCALAIGILLSLKAQRGSDGDEHTQSSTADELTFVAPQKSSRSQSKASRKGTRVKGSVTIVTNKIIKAKVDEQTARDIMARQNKAIMKKHKVVVAQEDFMNKNALLNHAPIVEPRVIADFNSINRIFQQRVRALSLRLEAQRAALREVTSADGLPTQNEVDREPTSDESNPPKVLRYAVLYTNEARRYAGGVNAIYDEISGRMALYTDHAQRTLGYDSTTFWVARYTNSRFDDQTLKMLQDVDVILLYTGSANRVLTALND